MKPFARIPARCESWEAHAQLPRHRHDLPYAAVVLSGEYEECGNGGRHRLRPGDVTLHAAFDALLDRFGARASLLLNFALAPGSVRHTRVGRVRDPDLLARTAECDAAAARLQLFEDFEQTASACQDWPDTLAAHLSAHPRARLGAWAREHGLAAETVSRGFASVFGVSPSRFRAEARALAAIRCMAETDASLGRHRSRNRVCRSGAYEQGDEGDDGLRAGPLAGVKSIQDGGGAVPIACRA